LSPHGMTLKTFASKKYSRKKIFCKYFFPELENKRARFVL